MQKKLLMTTVVLLICLNLTVSAEKTENSNPLMEIRHTGANNYFDIRAEPGERGCIEFELINNYEGKMANKLFVYDSETAVNGGNIIMSPENFTADDTASWFSGGIDTIILEPGKSTDKKMYYQVPEKCVPGVYTAILAIYSDGINMPSVSSRDESDVSLMINSYYSSTLAIIIRIGDQPEGDVTIGDSVHITVSPGDGRSFLYIPVINSGDTYEFPIVDVRVFGSDGEWVFEDSRNMDIVYRKTESSACFETTGLITRSGFYDVEVSIWDPKNGEYEDSGNFTAEVNEKTVRKAVMNQAEKENEEADWEGYLVVGKDQLIFAGCSAAVMIFTAGIIIMLLKKQGKT